MNRRRDGAAGDGQAEGRMTGQGSRIMEERRTGRATIYGEDTARRRAPVRGLTGAPGAAQKDGAERRSQVEREQVPERQGRVPERSKTASESTKRPTASEGMKRPTASEGMKLSMASESMKRPAVSAEGAKRRTAESKEALQPRRRTDAGTPQESRRVRQGMKTDQPGLQAGPQRRRGQENEARLRVLWGALGVLVVLLIVAMIYELVLGNGKKQTGSERMAEQTERQLGQPQTGVSVQPQTDGADQSQADGADQSQAGAADQSQAGAAGQPQSDGAGQPQSDGAGQPQSDGADQPQSDGADQPQSDGAGQSQTGATG